jgi:CheY-like chemotaxis protein
MPASKRRSAGVLRVLLVEDETAVAMMLEDMLAALGYTVIGPVARLDKAVAMAEREAVDVALLDVNLNGSEVYPVAAALAARGIPFAFCTGYGKAGLRAPYDDRPTLPKPFLLRTLRDLIAKLCPAASH